MFIGINCCKLFSRVIEIGRDKNKSFHRNFRFCRKITGNMLVFSARKLFSVEICILFPGGITWNIYVCTAVDILNPRIFLRGQIQKPYFHLNVWKYPSKTFYRNFRFPSKISVAENYWYSVFQWKIGDPIFKGTILVFCEIHNYFCIYFVLLWYLSLVGSPDRISRLWLNTQHSPEFFPKVFIEESIEGRVRDSTGHT